MTFDPLGKILGKKIVKDSYGKNKKVLLLVGDKDEQDELFKTRVDDDKDYPKDIKVPFIHPGGSVLEIYSRRKRK